MPHTERPSLYAGCDVPLLPTVRTPGASVVAALACGRVAVVSEYTGAHEVIENGVNGFVLDGVGSPEQIATLLDGPLARRETRAPIGARTVETAAAFDRKLLYERFRAAHHTAYASRLRHARERRRSR